MQLVKKLDMRQTKYGLRTFGLFHCNFCGENTEDILLRGSRNKSCGCFRGRHGFSNGEFSRLYKIWKGMRSRCNNKNVKSYADYGSKGIKVCPEWNNFLNFKEWALSNGYSDVLTIDRRDNFAGYSPDNCRFVSKTKNSQHKTTTKLLEDEREEILELYKTGNYTQRGLAILFNCHFTTIGDFLRGKTWKH